MKCCLLLLLFSFSFFSFTSSEETRENVAEGPIIRARLEVKAFIRQLLPHHHDVNIRYIPGKDPTMVFLNADNKVVLEEDVAVKKRDEISQLLEKHGLMKSAEARSEVPEDPIDDELEEPDEHWAEDEDEEDTEELGQEEEDDEEEGEGEGAGDMEDDIPEHTEL